MENEFWMLNIKDICNHDLLSHAEEVAVFRAIEASNDPDEVMQLRNKIIMHNGRLVAKVALRYRNHYGIQPRELVQEGMLGLFRAVEKFDYRRGNRFSTYAMQWIRQAIGRYIANTGRAIRIPSYKHDLYHKLLDLHTNSPDLSVEEQAEMLGASVEAVRQCIQLGPGVLSLDANPRTNDDPDFEDAYTIIPDAGAAVDYSDARKLLEEKLATLDYREEKILRLRFGFDNGEFLTLEEVAQRFNLTRERIRQVEAGALRKLAQDKTLRELLFG